MMLLEPLFNIGQPVTVGPLFQELYHVEALSPHNDQWLYNIRRGNFTMAAVPETRLIAERLSENDLRSYLEIVI